MQKCGPGFAKEAEERGCSGPAGFGSFANPSPSLLKGTGGAGPAGSTDPCTPLPTCPAAPPTPKAGRRGRPAAGEAPSQVQQAKRSLGYFLPCPAQTSSSSYRKGRVLIYFLDVRHVKLPSSIYLLFIKNIYIYISQQRCGEKPVLNLPEPLSVHDPPATAALLLRHVQGPSTSTSTKRAASRAPPRPGLLRGRCAKSPCEKYHGLRATDPKT